MKKTFAFALFFAAIFAFADENEKTEKEKRIETIKFGLENEVSSLLDELSREKNADFAENFSEELKITKNSGLRDKILAYFCAIEANLAEDFVISAIQAPQDFPKNTVLQAFRYAAAFKLANAAEPLRDIITEKDSNFLADAVRALGKIGNAADADFLAETFEDENPPQILREALVQAYGDIGSDSSFDGLMKVAKNEDESPFLRSRAIESLGKMKRESAVEDLAEFFNSEDLRIRAATVSALANFSQPSVEKIVLSAIKDREPTVRQAAVRAAGDKKFSSAVPSLLYRAQKDADEKTKFLCYDALAKIGGEEAHRFLADLIESEKTGDGACEKAVAALLSADFSAGIGAAKKAARRALSDERKKNLRYALAREFKKYESGDLADICVEYLQSKDPLTQGSGLDMFEKCRFSAAESAVRALAEKNSSVGRRAKSILGSGAAENAN